MSFVNSYVKELEVKGKAYFPLGNFELLLLKCFCENISADG